MTCARLTLSFRTLAAAFVLAVVFGLAPGRAAAACGDYVTIADPGQAATHSSQGEQSPAAPARPCHGPGCQQRPDSPVVPLTAPVGFSVQSKACTIRPAEERTPAGPDRLIPVNTSGRPVRSPTAIFHPPRAL